MMSTVASFFSVRNQSLIEQYDKEITSEGVTSRLWQGRLPLLATTWNLHTTQPKYFAQLKVRLSISPVLLKTKD
jgi:hypothetical protein